MNIYEHIFKIDLKGCESFILFHLEDTFITRLLTQHNLFEITKYDKQYEMSKTRTKHILLSNKYFIV